ncbi:MAG TPA: DUF3108 domain-containing protein [Blastocatellia bacterium]|nr:DUF3108 domain-containing protein [Blastocatellia bacterium]
MLMLKRAFILLAISALVSPGALAQTRSIKSDRNAPAKFVPTVGERLNYDVSWADFITAGELTLETKDRRSVDGVDAFHVSAQAQSVGLVSVMALKVNDVYESFLNAATLMPFRAAKNTRHGKKQDQGSMTLDQQKRTARLDDGRTIEIPPDTYDIAGLLFAIRGMELTPGRSREFNILEDGKLYKISVTPEAKEKVTTRAGTFDTTRVATKSLSGGRESNLYNLKMFITNDARRLPVMLTAEPSWGSVRVQLTSITGGGKR